jgi:hypothetical protein
MVVELYEEEVYGEEFVIELRGEWWVEGGEIYMMGWDGM